MEAIGMDRNGGEPACPQCGSAEVVPIIYGFPGPELAEESERGKVELGGCVVSDDDPRWCCKRCDHRWA